MPIRTQLLKGGWVRTQKKHIGSTPLIASRIVSFVYGRTQLVDCREVANKRVATDVKRQQQHQQQHQLVSF